MLISADKKTRGQGNFFKKNKGPEKSILEDLDSSLPLGNQELNLIFKIVKKGCNFSPPASDFKGEPLAELASAGEVETGRNSRLGKYLVAIDHNLGGETQ